MHKRTSPSNAAGNVEMGTEGVAITRILNHSCFVAEVFKV